MAQIHEVLNSRSGASRGVDGVTGENRVFSVTVEDEDIVTIPDGEGGTLGQELPDPRGLLALSGLAPIGSGHPWDTSAKASNYAIGERRGRVNWLVRVDYRRDTSVALPSTKGWLPTYRGTSVTRRLLKELEVLESSFHVPRSNIGRPTPTPTGDPVAFETAKLIGPADYKVVSQSQAGEADFRSKTFDADGNPSVVFLRETEARKLIGFNADWPAFELGLVRILPNFDEKRGGALIASHMKVVNDRPFRGAPNGHVLVAAISVDPVDMDVAGASEPGRAWRASLSLLWSQKPWTPFSIIPTHIDDRGNETPILHNGGKNDGQEVIENFRVRPTRNLYGLQSGLEGA